MSFKKIYVGIIIACLMPLGVFAAPDDKETQARLEQQIRDLTRMVAELTQQLNRSADNSTNETIPARATSDVLSGTTPKSNRGKTCFMPPQRTLTLGSKDIAGRDDVSRLQRWLASTPWYPEELITGYYGTLTQRAVERMQTAYGVVLSGTPDTTGFGVLGPRTRSAIARRCVAKNEKMEEVAKGHVVEGQAIILSGEQDNVVNNSAGATSPASVGTTSPAMSKSPMVVIPPTNTVRIKGATSTDMKQAGVAKIKQTKQELSYGVVGDTTLLLDVIYKKSDTSNKRAVIWLHGGGWQNGDKSDISPKLVDALLNDNMVVFSVNYRLVPDAVAPAQIHDVERSIRWVKKHASEYSVDPDKITVMGEEAGGGLAVLVGATGKQGVFEYDDMQDIPLTVDSIINIAGQSDLYMFFLYEKLKGNYMTQNYIGCDPDICKSILARYNPMRYANAITVPILTIHAMEDTVVPYTMSSILTESLQNKGVDARLITVEKIANTRSLVEQNIPDIIAFLDSVGV